MGLTETSLRNLRLTNLGLKLAIIVILYGGLFLAVTLLGFEKTYSSDVFLPIHTNIEFFCVFVALCVFTVTWYSYLNNCSMYGYVIGLGLLAVGLLDLMHFYSYEGMPTILTAPCANRATLYHVIARTIMALTFLGSVFLYKIELCVRGRIRFILLSITLALVGVIIATITFNQQFFPTVYIEGSGLTEVKVIWEYFIIFLLSAGVLGYLWLYKKYMEPYLQLITSTLLISVFSEICFISYGSVYDTTNLLGHLFRFSSYLLIYVAVFLHHVKRPYKELESAREELARANDILEERVRERTRKLQEANERLSLAATHDFLTGAINRMEFSNRFSKLLENAKGNSIHSVMAIDFDSFKKINDTYGHAVGDECLKTFVKGTVDIVRPFDSVARFGGDEFMVLLPDTPRGGALVVGEKIRKHLLEIADPPFTISIGIAEWPKDGKKEKDLLASADQALYLAKEKGKNQVV